MKHAGWQPKPHPVPQPRKRRLGPSVGQSLLWGLGKRCPACGRGKLFRRWFVISERCPRCGLKFERIEGHWIGAIGTNTVVTFALILVLLISSLIAFVNTDVSRWYITGGLVVVAASIPPFIDPFTRTFWTAIDIAMRPLEAYEVDWTVVDPAAVAKGVIPSESKVSGNTPEGESLSSPGITREPVEAEDQDVTHQNEDP